MKRITVIGAGTMGNGIAHAFAQNNFKVNIVDISLESLNKALETIEKNLNRLVAKEKITEELKVTTLNNISTYTSLSEGVESADLVVEAATENLDLKLNIFKELDNICDSKTILATNTSSISITQIAEVTGRPKKSNWNAFYESCSNYEISRGY
jgi:3-hydroxybutyryl-CoA dehydrogenase